MQRKGNITANFCKNNLEVRFKTLRADLPFRTRLLHNIEVRTTKAQSPLMRWMIQSLLTLALLNMLTLTFRLNHPMSVLQKQYRNLNQTVIWHYNLMMYEWQFCLIISQEFCANKTIQVSMFTMRTVVAKALNTWWRCLPNKGWWVIICVWWHKTQGHPWAEGGSHTLWSTAG